MYKGKEWLKEQIKHEEVELKYAFDNYVPYEKVLIADDVNELLNQLEEPEQEKVVVPQFVADWIEDKKGWSAFDVFYDIDEQDVESNEVSKWLYDNDDEETAKREIVLLQALRSGYTVEEFRRVLKIGKMYFINGGANYRQDLFNIQLTDNKESAHVFESEQEVKDLQSDIGGELEEI